jgi:hypothetical protein
MVRSSDSFLLNHVGWPSTIRFAGPAGFSKEIDYSPFVANYELDLSNPKERVYNHRRGTIRFDPVEACWVLRSASSGSSGGGALVCSQMDASMSSPEGSWEGGCLVSRVAERPSLVAQLAFPAPTLDLDFYSENGIGRIPLLKHPGLVMLRVGNNRSSSSSSSSSRVPAVMLRCHGATFTVLYSHGNAKDVGLVVEDLEGFGRSVKANVFAYDYVGYDSQLLSTFCLSWSILAKC